MFFSKCWFVWDIFLLFIQLPLTFSEDVINVEVYYGGNKMEIKKNMDCSLKFHRLFCSFQCSERKSVCLKDSCFCQQPETLLDFSRITQLKSQLEALKSRPLYVITQDQSTEDSAESSSPLWKPDKSVGTPGDHKYYSDEASSEEIPLNVILSQPPILRHHIAHFCPNLLVAENCIRTCMKKGQQAFCGKDHVCYCDHKYTSHDIKIKKNATEQREEWRQWYDLYFGTDNDVGKETQGQSNSKPDTEDGPDKSEEVKGEDVGYSKPAESNRPSGTVHQQGDIVEADDDARKWFLVV